MALSMERKMKPWQPQDITVIWRVVMVGSLTSYRHKVKSSVKHNSTLISSSVPHFDMIYYASVF